MDILVEQALLTPNNLTIDRLVSVLGSMLSNKIDLADFYLQQQHIESWTLEEGIIKNTTLCVHKGVGVRAVSYDKTGFAYSDTIDLAHITEAASAAKHIANSGGIVKINVNKKESPKQLYEPINPCQSLTIQEKINILRSIDDYARKDRRITQVIASLVGSHEFILIMASDGTYVHDIRPLVRLNVTVIAEANNKRERATFGGGGRFDYKVFQEKNLGKEYAAEAVRQALVLLDAGPAPAGNMPVVLGAGWPGILLHEAIGHGLEGDFNRKKTSAFSDLLGTRVATELCTVIDDGTIENRRGSLNIDDEGTPTQRNVLIEKGILKTYMQDKMNAKLMNMLPTGNGRRESYAHIPLPRMTNTFMLAGEDDPVDIIKAVDRGIYAVTFGGGQVDITTGKFVFEATEAYLIEGGKISSPIKGAMLIGNGPEALMQVKMVGYDLKLDPGIGTCGKEGQSVPVGVGQPTLLLANMTVGGTEYGA